jgi:hypothetical protein
VRKLGANMGRDFSFEMGWVCVKTSKGSGATRQLTGNQCTMVGQASGIFNEISFARKQCVVEDKLLLHIIPTKLCTKEETASRSRIRGRIPTVGGRIIQKIHQCDRTHIRLETGANASLCPFQAHIP